MYYKGAAWKGGGVVPPSSIWGHMGPHLPIPNMDPTLQDATINPLGLESVEVQSFTPVGAMAPDSQGNRPVGKPDSAVEVW